MSGGGDYVLRSHLGDELIRIPTTTSVNDLRYMIDNLPRLKTVIQNQMVKGMSQCGGMCGQWGMPWQEHDSGSGMGYNCKPIPEKDRLPGFSYWNRFTYHHILCRQQRFRWIFVQNHNPDQKRT